MIEIRKDIPVPKFGNKIDIYPFDKMIHGDAIVLSCLKHNRHPVINAYKVYMANNPLAKFIHRININDKISDQSEIALYKFIVESNPMVGIHVNKYHQ